MPVADHRDEDFAVLQVVADLGARHRYERETRIRELLRDERSKDTADLLIDPRDALRFHFSYLRGAAAGSGSRQFCGDLLGGVGLDDVSDFEILEARELDTAFEVFGDFANVVFET